MPLLSPTRDPALRGDLDPEGHAPAGTARTGNLCTKGRHSKGDQETLPLKWEPHSQLTRLVVPRRRCGGARRRKRRESKGDLEGGWEAEEEGRGRLGGGTETQTGARRGRRPLCLRTMGRGKGAQGGAGRRAGLRCPPSRVGLWWHSSLAVAIHSSSFSVSRGPHPLPLAALEKLGVQTYRSSWPTRGGGP